METILGFFQSGLSTIGPFIILLGLLIFVHELGHFLVAKYFGVRVEVFSLGFGKKIFQYKKGDTNYCLSLIPLGGYVKMYGDEINADISEDQKKYSFTHKPVSQRIAVVLAGPLMNLFFAVLVFFVIAIIGEKAKAPVIGDVAEDSKAFASGFRSGDKVLKVGQDEVKTWDEFQHYLNKFHGQSVAVEVEREDSNQTSALSVIPELAPNPNILSLDETVGTVEGINEASRASSVGVRHNSPAARSGLRTGDLITSINGRDVKYFRQLENRFIQLQSQPIQLQVLRYEDLKKPPVKHSFEIAPSQFASMAVLGFERPDLYLARVIEDSPAAAAGLKSGDRITRVGTAEPKEWDDILRTVKSFSGEGSIEIGVEREGSPMSFQMTPKLTSHMNSQGGEEKRFTIGIIPWVQSQNPEAVVLKPDSLGAAFSRGIERTYEVSAMTVVSFIRLIQTKISPKNIGGVISIGQAASETFKMGVVEFLTMMAVISINLFILNLLPVPVLDGGHLVFYTIEALRGAPLSMRKMEIAQQVGLAILMSLMAFALFNDFSRVFGSL